MAMFSNIQKMTSLLGGRVFSIKPALHFSSINHCFSYRQPKPKLPATSPWLMVPPTLVLDDIIKRCRTCNIVRSPTTTFKVKRNSEVKPDDDNYYHLLNVADKKLAFKKKKEDIRLPWTKDYFSPHEAICIGSSHGWLFFINPHNCTPYLYNPFSVSNASMPCLALPPIETLPFNLPYIDSGRRLINIKLEILHKKFTVSGRELSKNLFRKVIMSGDPSSKYTDCTVMALFHDPTSEDGQQQLAFCRIGDDTWTGLGGDRYSYSDIFYFSKNNRFYAVGCEREEEDDWMNGEYQWLECWDFTDPSSPHGYRGVDDEPNVWSLPITDQQKKVREGCCREIFLVESSEELLAVVRYYRSSGGKFVTKAFDVFMLKDDGGWQCVPNIGDRTLLLGGYQSVCVSAHDCPGLKKNCIYFTAHDDCRHNQSTELGIYNLEDERMEYSFDLEETEPSPVWVIPRH